MALPRASNLIGDDDQILGVFVVRFDTLKGNMVEWFTPETLPTSSLEFKAMASGLHNINRDFIYFKMQDIYGVSCYEKRAVDSVEERGSRMRSVGVLCGNFNSLHRHLQFLQEQAAYQTEHSGDYSHLIEYYHARKTSRIDHFAPLEDYIEIPQLSNEFPKFMAAFGNQVFVLWKAMLLKKRILFYSPPPLGSSCLTVYCCCLLSAISKPYIYDTAPNPLFYVNVADIDSLCTLQSYVACTTEAIFHDKQRLYDIYVNGRELIIPDPNLADMLNTTPQESELRLQRIQSPQAGSREAPKSPFLALNDSLLDSMVTRARKGRTIGRNDMIALFQISSGDFFNALAEMYNIDIGYASSCCNF